MYGFEIPAFLVIGVQKAGTTSFYASITKHPQIREAIFKELHFFNWHFDKGINWYLNCFPKCISEKQITGEATPNYLYNENPLLEMLKF